MDSLLARLYLSLDDTMTEEELMLIVNEHIELNKQILLIAHLVVKYGLHSKLPDT
jgi:hypothetical protein